MSRKSDLIAVLSLAIILALTAVCLLIWMSVLRWEDRTGAVVGVIFIILTVIQSGLSVFWYKVTGRKQAQFVVPQEQMEHLQGEEAL